MAAELLTQSERTKLLDVFFDGRLTLDGVEKKVKELIPSARFTDAANEIRNICRDLIFSCDGPALNAALYALDVMRKAHCVAAKAAIFDVLVELEKAIRLDMFLQEQIKYSSKDPKEGRKGTDAAHADELRIHSIAKLFILDLLGDSVPGSGKASARYTAVQEDIDSALDAWEKSSMLLKEPLAELTHCWKSHTAKRRCGAPLENGAVFDSQPQKRSAVLMRTASAKIPSLPVAAGELHFLVPSEKAVLLFDAQAPSSEWETARSLLEKASSTALSTAEQEKLLGALTDSVMKRIEFSGKVVCGIAQHDPETCAAVVSKLPVSVTSPLIQTLITSQVPASKVETVLLYTPKSMEHINLRTLIAERVRQHKEKTMDKEAATSFMDCLYQLVTKGNKENKGLYIAEALKSDLSPIAQMVWQGADSSKWDEMKK